MIWNSCIKQLYIHLNLVYLHHKSIETFYYYEIVKLYVYLQP